MKKTIKLTYQICRFVAISILFCGFLLTKIWTGVIVSLVFVLLEFLLHHFQLNGLASARLVGYASIAVAGILSDVSPFLIIVGVTASLACWELNDQLPSLPKTILLNSYEKLHLIWLALTSTIGLIVGEACLFLKFHLPFSVIIFIALIILYSFFQLYKIFNKAQSNRL